MNGDVHTNRIEGFWALYKCAWKSTYTHNARKHALGYVNERAFAFNNRQLTDLGRMNAVVSEVTNRGMTYDELISEVA